MPALRAKLTIAPISVTALSFLDGGYCRFSPFQGRWALAASDAFTFTATFTGFATLATFGQFAASDADTDADASTFSLHSLQFAASDTFTATFTGFATLAAIGRGHGRGHGFSLQSGTRYTVVIKQKRLSSSTSYDGEKLSL